MAVEQKAYPHPHVNDAWLARLREDVLEPDLPIIDAHHHLWERPSGVYLLPQLKADVTAGHNVRGTVFIQCGYGFRNDGPPELRPVGETETVVKIAVRRRSGHLRRHHRLHRFSAGRSGRRRAGSACRGRQGTLPRNPAERRLGSGDSDADLGARPTRIARRSRVPGRPGTAWRRFGLTYESSLYHPQLPELAALARALPEQPILANHCGGYIAIGPHGENLTETFHALARRPARTGRLSERVSETWRPGDEHPRRGVPRTGAAAVLRRTGRCMAAGDGNVHRNVRREPLHVRE